VTASQLDEQLAADLWLLTPPCQPYTTTSNARRRDTADPRAASLLHLMSPAVLPAMQRPPTRLMMENVPGFVGSDSHKMMVAALGTAGYELQEFIVSPHQLGVPYSRPRYFALAVRRPLSFPRQYDCSRGPLGQGMECRTRPGRSPATSEEVGAGPAADAEAAIATAAAGATKDGVSSSDPWVAYAVSAAQLARFWRVLDVVTPSSTYCNCFTKHYTDNLLAAGSVLASEDFAEPGEAHAEAVVLGLRFFSPDEVAAIHGVRADWAARARAAGLQPRQQYALLGNGLSVDVASYLLTYLLQAQ
ncbi:hypothetical protein VOLCADRAFT_63767, partial [Volvox carteri f. nagariensis]